MKMIQTLLMLAMAVFGIGSCSSPMDNNPVIDEQLEENKAEGSKGKTLVIYYSYTGNTRDIVTDLKKQIN